MRSTAYCGGGKYRGISGEMISFRNHKRSVPGLNTASLPDLIFTVLFFFMIVTHMRKSEVKVKYQVPQGTELTKLVKKSTVTYIYVGKHLNNQGQTAIQINDKLVENTSQLSDYIEEERASMQPQDAQNMTISLKADNKTPNEIISKIKQELRKADALKVNFSAGKKKINNKQQ